MKAFVELNRPTTEIVDRLRERRRGLRDARRRLLLVALDRGA